MKALRFIRDMLILLAVSSALCASLIAVQFYLMTAPFTP